MTSRRRTRAERSERGLDEHPPKRVIKRAFRTLPGDRDPHVKPKVDHHTYTIPPGRLTPVPPDELSIAVVVVVRPDEEVEPFERELERGVELIRWSLFPLGHTELARLDRKFHHDWRPRVGPFAYRRPPKTQAAQRHKEWAWILGFIAVLLYLFWPLLIGVKTYANAGRSCLALLAGAATTARPRSSTGPDSRLGATSGVCLRRRAGGCRALQLDEVERLHLFDLVRTAKRRPTRAPAGTRAAPARVQRLLGAITGAAAWGRVR